MSKSKDDILKKARRLKFQHFISRKILLTWHVVWSVTPHTIRWMPSTQTFNSILYKFRFLFLLKHLNLWIYKQIREVWPNFQMFFFLSCRQHSIFINHYRFFNAQYVFMKFKLLLETFMLHHDAVIVINENTSCILINKYIVWFFILAQKQNYLNWGSPLGFHCTLNDKFIVLKSKICFFFVLLQQ